MSKALLISGLIVGTAIAMLAAPRAEAEQYDPNSNPIYVKFQELKKALAPVYGEVKVKQLEGMSNEEINDAHLYVFKYANLTGKGEGAQAPPADLATRIIAIRDKFKIFN